MSFRPILYVIGLLLLVLSGVMLLPAFIDLVNKNDDWVIFLSSSAITAFFGGFLILSNKDDSFDFSIRTGFLLTTLAWIVLTLFSSLPFYISDLSISFTDSFFEAMSGITTTGSTVLTGLDTMPPGLLLWRSLLQWIGGIGVIVMALSVFPFLKVGGMQLFSAESSERDKALPRAAQLATSIAFVYTFLTAVCAILYMMFGMNGFDAVNHAMTTIATGGFSTHDASLGHFNNTSIRTIATLFMITSGLPFVLYLKALKGDYSSLFEDTQVRWFISIVLFFITLTAIRLYYQGTYTDWETLLSHTAFNVTSIITGTGYATDDYMAWGSFAVGVLFFLSFVGGCAGSTTCAIKIFRFQVVYAVTVTQIKKLLHPHGVFTVRYNHQPVPKGVPLSVLSFIFLYGLSFVLSASLLQFIGLDFITAMSGAATAISNVGPGLGPIIGPSGTFQSLPDAAKWVLSFCMLLGRLELFTVLVIFLPRFWRG
jgi:trk system potassium uptake protein TrkH